MNDIEIVAVQDIQLTPRLASLKLTLLLVLVELGAIVSLLLRAFQHNDTIIRRGIEVDRALPYMLVLLAAASNALERSLVRLWVSLAWTLTA